MIKAITVYLFKIMTIAIIFTGSASSEVICMKAKIKKNGKIKLTNVTAETTCPRGSVQVVDTDEIKDPLVFGDGSDGDLVVSTDTIYDSTNEYENITIGEGQKLFVSSGTTIRCAGSFTANGALIINNADSGGYLQNVNVSSMIALNPAEVLASQPAYGPAAGNGEYGDDSLQRFGGIGGGTAFATGSEFLRAMLNPLINAGGSGGGSGNSLGASSGGSVRIICKGAINISTNGGISASGSNADSCGGGGGGGMVILASATTISNSGTVQAQGGNGGTIGADCGAGGGGAGGLVHFIAPSVVSGTVTVTGGAGRSAGVLAVSPRSAGGGGGGGIGTQGGQGSLILSGADGNVMTASQAGQDGNYYETLADKTHLLK